eukprot:gene23577-31402_t
MCCETGHTLAAASADAKQQGVAKRLPDHSAHPAAVHDGILEENE